MARRYDFKPDRQRTDILGKLLLTKKQRQGLLRWILYGLVCLVGLLLQDVALYRMQVAGVSADLVPCLILMVAVMRGAESGSIFALITACLYYFSGSAVGAYVIPLIAAVAIFMAIFRQSNLRSGFGAILLCTVGGMLLYECGLFCIGWFLRLTTFQRWPVALLTAFMSILAVPLVYPVLLAIGRIGGETWKE